MTDNRYEDESTQISVVEKNDPVREQERRPALISLRGELLATPIPLERDRVVLGRAVEADIRLNDFKTSRLHAEITVQSKNDSDRSTFRIKDLGSTNGTIVNGQRITETTLNYGDKIIIGDYLFRFELLDEIDWEFQNQIHRLLVHDELTGLLTSKSFFSELRREAARAEIEALPFGVLMMDIDHFKRVNDSYGHLVGNRMLEDLGGIIKSELRVGDVAARFGGEEFAAFLLEADQAQALVAAERVRRAVEQHRFSVMRQGTSEPTGPVRITVSIGVAFFPDDAKDPIELVELADSALYHAKRGGRNRVCTYQPSLAISDKPLPPRRIG